MQISQKVGLRCVDFFGINTYAERCGLEIPWGHLCWLKCRSKLNIWKGFSGLKWSLSAFLSYFSWQSIWVFRSLSNGKKVWYFIIRLIPMIYDIIKICIITWSWCVMTLLMVNVVYFVQSDARLHFRKTQTRWECHRSLDLSSCNNVLSHVTNVIALEETTHLKELSDPPGK